MRLDAMIRTIRRHEMRAPIGQKWLDVLDAIANHRKSFAVFDNIANVAFGR